MRLCAATSVLQLNMERFPELRSQQANMRGRMRAHELTTEAPPPNRNIPVVFHIIDPVDPGRVTDAQVQSQIDVLNQDYNNNNADQANVPPMFKAVVGNPGISFHLAENGITRFKTTVQSFSPDEAMKFAARGGVDVRDPQKFLNIWVCPLGGGVLGYAQFPNTGLPETDGVVIATNGFGKGGTSKAPFHLGRTAVHEVGHYLGLFHIWGNDPFENCTDDDEVADTPVQRGPNGGKPPFPSHSCDGQANGDLFMNYMDYVDDDTMVMFSQGQVARMHAALALSRPGLGLGPVA
jgi:Pregnancy-associated plasma protein-A